MADEGKMALVTGASSGIGKRLAHRFAAGGFDLLLVARRQDRLDALAEELTRAHGIAAEVFAADLADPAGPGRIVARVGEMGREVAALVNNAGFGLHGPFAESPAASQMDLINVNIASVVHLTRSFLPVMLARRRGWVLNVASTAAFGPGPFMATYFASKAFILSFSEALAAEVEGTGVIVSVLCPGPTVTGFAEVAGVSKSRMFRQGVMDVEPVAKAGYEGLMAGKRVIIPGLSNRILVRGGKLIPRRMLTRITQRLVNA